MWIQIIVLIEFKQMFGLEIMYKTKTCVCVYKPLCYKYIDGNVEGNGVNRLLFKEYWDWQFTSKSYDTC